MSTDMQLLNWYNKQIMQAPKGSSIRQEWIRIKREIEKALPLHKENAH